MGMSEKSSWRPCVHPSPGGPGTLEHSILIFVAATTLTAVSRPGDAPIDLELPIDALARHKAVGLWYEGDTLRVRAHLRDTYTEPDGTPLVLHEYRLDLWVDLATMEVTDAAVDPIHLPYGECFDAAPQIQRLVGLRLERGFTGEALRRLTGEVGCTHLNSLISDLAIAGLFHGYLRVREQTRAGGVVPLIPASDERTGICAGWRSEGTLATWMEQGRGIAPSHIYPTGPDARVRAEEP